MNKGITWGNPNKVYKTNDGYLLNFNISHTEGDYYYTEQVTVPTMKYGVIVDILVNAVYDNSAVTAITLNHLAVLDGTADDAKVTEYNNEYQLLQAWRSRAKEIAKEAIAYAEENNIQ